MFLIRYYLCQLDFSGIQASSRYSLEDSFHNCLIIMRSVHSITLKRGKSQDCSLGNTLHSFLSLYWEVHVLLELSTLLSNFREGTQVAQYQLHVSA